jgi:hypothetical protein
MGELAALEDMCEPIEPSLQNHYNERRFYDENAGEELDPVLVARACEDELQRFKKMKVYRLVLKTEAKQGKIAKVKWVRTNKGAKTAPEVRCRLVAMEFGFNKPREDLFAGAPPLFAMKLLLSLIASQGKPRSKIIMLLDVKCAFLYGKTKRTVYIELPPEDPNHRCGKYYGLLEEAMCGARDAPQIWQEVVAEVMMRLEFKASLHHPSVYFHPERDIRVIARVDLCTGDEVQMDWLYKELSLEYDLKVQKVSGDSRRNQEAKFLNRTIRVTDEGIQIMGDEKHAQILLREWGMDNCKGLDNPVGAKVKDVLEEQIPMDPDDA